MNRFFIISFFVFFSTLLFAQQRYFIYFKDKGERNIGHLDKSLDIESIAKSTLSERSIKRRKKNNTDNFFTYSDLPLNTNYVKQLQNLNVKIIHKLKWFNAVSANLSDKQIQKITALDFVDKIVKVKSLKVIRPKGVNVQQTAQLDKSNQINAYDYGVSLTQNQLSDIPQVHNLGITGQGVRIGILDSGFDWKTPNSLKDRNVIAEHDFVNNDSITANETTFEDSVEQDYHGTGVFSILGGFDEGTIIGPAFNADFLLAKTEYVPTETHVEEDNYAAALEWMDSIGVDITSSSIGYDYEFEDFGEEPYTYKDLDGNTTIVTKAANLAFQKGIVVVTSAGNEGDTFWHYVDAPADGFNVLAIGAVNSANSVAYFSSRGPTYDGRIKPELVAQGVNVYYTITGKINIKAGDGASFSTPIAAGIAGLLLSAYPNLTNKQVRDILIHSGDNVENPNNDIGYGLISAIRAVSYPNVENIDGKYYVNKIFPDYENISNNSVELFTESGISYPVTNTKTYYFRSELPSEVTENSNKIYFTYKDNQNNTLRSPTAGYYELYIDDSIVNLKEKTSNIPDKFNLSQNYPNPFNPTTIISYSIPNITKLNSSSAVEVKLSVYDILGRKVSTLVDGFQPEGNYKVTFNGHGFPSGVYFYQLRLGNFTDTKKMTLLK